MSEVRGLGCPRGGGTSGFGVWAEAVRFAQPSNKAPPINTDHHRMME
jgi:hypothetical protein